MDEAPLTLAHSHARKASVETSKKRLDVAATEHEAAAVQFEKAQELTSDIEALRMLKLLEAHHRQLADVIKSKHTIAKAIQDAKEPMPSPSSSPSASPIPSQPNPVSPVARVHPSRRESSPALAKDMATRRGIPPQHPQPAARKIPPPVALISPQSIDRRINPPQPVESMPPHSNKESDDSFARFYSNWTTGPFSRLSSMLAFAALPLTETPQPDSPTSSRHENTSGRATSDPDLKSLISPAAINALQKHGHIGPGESFYIIPPSGGTASYANIVSREQRYARRQHLSNISEEDSEFVDAQETQSRHHKLPNSYREEELQLENETLKQVLDQMSHRLSAFESHAQDASMAALTQSMASVRTAPGGRQEDDLKEALREIQKLKHDNAKYKSYYARLKDSARARAEEKKKAGSAA